MVNTAHYKQNRRNRIFNDQGGLCHYCHLPMIPITDGRQTPESATYDHIIPLALGGTGKRENIVMAHKKCNHEKGLIDYITFLFRKNFDTKPLTEHNW